VFFVFSIYKKPQRRQNIIVYAILKTNGCFFSSYFDETFILKLI